MAAYYWHWHAREDVRSRTQKVGPPKHKPTLMGLESWCSKETNSTDTVSTRICHLQVPLKRLICPVRSGAQLTRVVHDLLEVFCFYMIFFIIKAE